MTTLRQRMLDDLRVRNYAAKTQTMYIQRVAEFAAHFGRSRTNSRQKTSGRNSFTWSIPKRVSWSGFNQTVCALRFLYKVTLGRGDLVPDIPFARAVKKLPTVISTDEVLRSAARRAPAETPGRAHDDLRGRPVNFGSAGPEDERHR